MEILVPSDGCSDRGVRGRIFSHCGNDEKALAAEIESKMNEGKMTVYLVSCSNLRTGTTERTPFQFQSSTSTFIFLTSFQIRICIFSPVALLHSHPKALKSEGGLGLLLSALCPIKMSH